MGGRRTIVSEVGTQVLSYRATSMAQDAAHRKANRNGMYWKTDLAERAINMGNACWTRHLVFADVGPERADW